MTSEISEEESMIATRYREYCDICQSGNLKLLINYWSLPALFSVDFGSSENSHLLIQTPQELEELYSKEFGASTGIDKTTIDSFRTTFFGKSSASIETKLRHTRKEILHDQQHAVYGCHKIDGKWMFMSHISKIEKKIENQ